MTQSKLETWLLVGSQHLYGPAALDVVRQNAQAVADGLNRSGLLPLPVVGKGICTTSDEITTACRTAAADPRCAGVIVWMHTFSPAKMWLAGLKSLQKPLLHLHTQFQEKLPWSTIDMDFMNLHQAAHGDREFGHGCTRVGIKRTVVVGHWQAKRVQEEIATWQRAALGVSILASTKVARIGDNMRSVAVTEGDKVAAQLALGLEVHGYGIGDLVASIAAVEPAALSKTLEEIDASYDLMPCLRKGGARRASLETEARVEIGLERFLVERGCTAVTTTFEDLHGLSQLPGLAIQRLMARGYGFGAEGDWKTAALVRTLKVMATGLSGGCSFMEDYTYDLTEGSWLVLGAHMLEVCPTIASARPSLEIHPLGIGSKADPLRLVFDGAAGPAVNASLIDLGDRFRLILNQVEAIAPPQPLPRLPVARAVWRPLPDLPRAAAAWIQAGGAHHTAYTQALGMKPLQILAEMLNVECISIA